MPTVIYFDCFSGISGDMALGALLDAGLSLDALRGELSKLELSGWAIDAERTVRGYLAGTRAHVHAPEQPMHRRLADVRAIVEASRLAQDVKQRSLQIFALLAEAEGRVHGIDAEAVHFHEVGALDAIVDIVGVVVGLALLGIAQVYASPLPLGSGWVRATHGLLPVPAPAVMNLLAAAGAPTLPDDRQGELVTPTGAALLTGLATFGRPSMRLMRVGYGFGARQSERPNALRVWVGTTREETRRRGDEETESGTSDSVSVSPVLLETNIDDQPAEQLGYVVEQLFALGVLDAWLTPVLMKKGRPGIVLSVLVPDDLEVQAVTLIMQETTTLGVRRREVDRYVCEREIVRVETPLGAVRVKRKRWAGHDLGSAPEYEDCARLAREHGLPLREVYRLVEGD